ncbi:MAG: tetratricopeptide repeat protein [Bryobacterales bacterium]|nr:tetratricopeptide repeat protein [Bryobacterales bacterium]
MEKKAPAAAQRRIAGLYYLGAGLLIFVLLVMAYLPALEGGLLWDDDAYVTPPELQSAQGLGRIWFDLGATAQYYPFVYSAFWIEHRIWGDATLGYHLVNIIFHTISACLILAIMRRLFLPGAWLGALIFALHPVFVESVAWITEQKNTLSGVFYLSAALLYLRFDESRKRKLYFWAFTLFLLAILSKSVTATLPAALLVVLWWRHGKLDSKNDVAPLAPWLAVGIGGGIVTAWMERKFVGAEGVQFDLSFVQRLLIAGRALWFYCAKLVWPVNLMFVYPRWNIDAHAPLQYLFLAGVLIVAAGLIWMARRWRGPLAGFLFFAGTLMPALGFLNVYPFLFSYVADHFQYLASLGVIVPAAGGLAMAGRRVPPAAAWAGSVIVTALMLLTWSQSGAYRSAETLYRETLARNPGAWMAEGNLGSELMKIPGRTAEAVPHLQAALRLNPGLAEAHNNLGLILSDDPQRLNDAISEFQAALRSKPNYAEAHNNLGSALSDAGRREEAIGEFRKALAIRPNYAEAHNNLGSALSELPDRLPAAIAEFQAALAINPNLAEAHANFAAALARAPGRLQEAIYQMELAVRLRPEMQQWREMLGKMRTAAADAAAPGR